MTEEKESYHISVAQPNGKLSQRITAMDTDEIDPPRPTLEPKDLEAMSIEHLERYIVSLKNEIKRVDDTISKKESHRSGADSLFNIG